MLDIMTRGGPIMWPLLLCSLTTLAIAIERAIFFATTAPQRSPRTVEAIVAAVAMRDVEAARQTAAASRDPVACTLAAALHYEGDAFAAATIEASAEVLAPYQRGVGGPWGRS